MNKERLLTCIVCPRGCRLSVALGDGGEVLAVDGNICKRGAAYAEAECTHPVRTVTSTVRCADGKVCPVKTSCTVPKEKIFEVMKEINAIVAPSILHIGDVIIANVAGTDADIVATASKE